MNELIQNLLSTIPLLLILFTIGWFYSFKTKVFSWLDFLWSASFLVSISFALYNDLSIPKILIALMYLVWSLRLSTHLFKRIKNHGEDKRYVGLIKKWKVWYGIYFFGLFQIEALLTAILSIPLFLNYGQALGLLHLIALVLFVIAILGETISDKQLKKFIEKNSRNEVCNIGFWNYSRHPNYFFEWMIWVSFAIFSLSSLEKWPGLIPAMVMYLFLTKVTGIPPAEESSLKSKGEKYIMYQKTTNAFFPWFKKTLMILVVLLISNAHISNTQAASGETMLQQEKIKYVFNALRADNLHILDDFYAYDTEFVDPLGTHKGLNGVKSYYKNLYQNVKDIKFETKDLVSNGNSHVFVWRMILVADGLNGGSPVTLEGNSHIKFNDQNLVIYHRDYFDMGEFIYEHIPVLGWTLKKIKQKLRGQ